MRPNPSMWSFAVTHFKMNCPHNGKFPYFSNRITGEQGFICEYGCGFFLNFDPTRSQKDKFPDGVAYVDGGFGKVITFAKEGTKMGKD